ncbi:hypothetical protein [Amycolatopsis solani]|uniref:hypothetical protein n=1 Tax=Amycolatopsis solani TaxID=3028615 RepID=UPI0025AF6932|nr:hypothetical protein [Amycolatopsis sp. MEP2-6]
MGDDEQPRYPVGQRLRYRETGTVWTIAADWHHHPDVARTAGVVDDRFYVVEVDGHRSVVYHGIIEQACDPIDDEPAAGDHDQP